MNVSRSSFVSSGRRDARAGRGRAFLRPRRRCGVENRFDWPDFASHKRAMQAMPVAACGLSLKRRRMAVESHRDHPSAAARCSSSNWVVPGNACPVVAAQFFPRLTSFFWALFKVIGRTHIDMSRQSCRRVPQRRRLPVIRCNCEGVVGHRDGTRRVWRWEGGFGGGFWCVFCVYSC